MFVATPCIEIHSLFSTLKWPTMVILISTNTCMFISFIVLPAKPYAPFVLFPELAALILLWASTSTLKLRSRKYLLEWGLRWDLKVMKLLKEGKVWTCFQQVGAAFILTILYMQGAKLTSLSLVTGSVEQLLTSGVCRQCQNLCGQILTGDL